MTFSVVRAQTRRLQCDLPPSRRSHRSCKAGPVPNRRILPSANRRSHSTPTKADSIHPTLSFCGQRTSLKVPPTFARPASFFSVKSKVATTMTAEMDVAQFIRSLSPLLSYSPSPFCLFLRATFLKIRPTADCRAAIRA